MTTPKHSITPPAASTAAAATSDAGSSAASAPAAITPRGNSVTRTTLWLVAAVSVITAIAYATGEVPVKYMGQVGVLVGLFGTLLLAFAMPTLLGWLL